MRPLLLAILLILLPPGATLAAPADGIWITLGQPAWQLLKQNHPGLQSVSSRRLATGEVIDGELSLDSVYLVQVSEPERDSLMQLVHDQLHHCAGFFAYDSRAEALAYLVELGELSADYIYADGLESENSAP